MPDCTVMETNPDALLVSTIASHFPEARITDETVELGFGGVRIQCRIGDVGPFSGVQSAQLLFGVQGDELPGTIELAMSGYAPTIEEAVVQGACAWACSFGPVLRAALSDEALDQVPGFMAMHRGQTVRIYVDAFDQVLAFAEGYEDTQQARARFGLVPWLAFHVIGSGMLPLLTDRPQLLSVFVGEQPNQRIVEVKLDGVAYEGFDELVANVPSAPVPQLVLMREVAVIVPD